MKTITKLIACAAITLGSCAPKPAAIELFNGTDLTGWVGYLTADSLDTAKEFTVRDGVICLSGPMGYIRTEATYTDYKLEVEWRWPGEPTNSGIFQRMQLPDQGLPQCFECQLMSGSAGDLLGLAGARTAEIADRSGSVVVIPKISGSSELPAGQWNRAEIVCLGGEITVTINDVLQNKATGMSLPGGHIALQSEGGPVEFRNVRLTPMAL
ncbi:MAG: DUF1080 domain-containing protein [Alistipes sp.]|jgi:hypothetical protein|nr:DUF1080 domain-containing protein [Alistipes sp.]